MATFYPNPVFHFIVQWGGSRVGFTEVSGLDQELQPIEYREGSSPDYAVTKMPGMAKYGNITLKRGIGDKDNEFATWLYTVRLNKIERRDLTVSLLNENHEPVMTWKLSSCFPTKVSGASLNSTGNEVAIESVEIAFEKLVTEVAA